MSLTALLPVCLCDFLCVCVCVSLCLHVCLLVCLFVGQRVCLHVCESDNLCAYSIFASVHLLGCVFSICQRLWLKLRENPYAAERTADVLPRVTFDRQLDADRSRDSMESCLGPTRRQLYHLLLPLTLDSTSTNIITPNTYIENR